MAGAEVAFLFSCQDLAAVPFVQRHDGAIHGSQIDTAVFDHRRDDDLRRERVLPNFDAGLQVERSDMVLAPAAESG
jgi:hypothetical protein